MEPTKENHSKVEEEEEVSNDNGPDSTQLVRRGALVPPKMDDPMEPVTDPGGPSGSGIEPSGQGQGVDAGEDYAHEGMDEFDSSGGLLGPSGAAGSLVGGHDRLGTSGFPPRRSSVVVIPPMQVSRRIM